MGAPLFSIVNTETPAEWAGTVTPSDTTVFSVKPRALYIGGNGNCSLLMADGDTVVFVGLTAGSILPIRCNRVNATGTTATNIVALY
jgi:hypothetical protein